MLSEMDYELDVDVKKLVELARYQAGIIPSGQFSGHLYKIQENK
jgi:hypothetical protein